MQDANSVTTERLYYRDAYATAFTAEVLSFEKNEVVLDRTLFFPEEGGQHADHGVLGGFPVIDVQISEGEIRHILDLDHPIDPENKNTADDVFKEGAEVSGEIDWKRRFSAMQQHSGEHIFSGLVHRIYGYENVGFHLSDREVTLDFDGALTMEQALEIEEDANAAIADNLTTEIGFYDRASREGIAYRSKLDLEGEVRIVTFPGIDRCACCAPHVKQTGEIGLLKVLSVQNYKGGTRVSILCGMRAMAAFREVHGWMTETANYLTAAAAEIPNLVRKMKTETLQLRQELAAADAERLTLKAEKTVREEGGADLFLFEERAQDSAVRSAINDLTARQEGMIGIFTGSDAAGWKFVIGSGKRDTRDAVKVLREKFGARGGGKPVMVQGSVNGNQKEILEYLKSSLQS